MDRTAADGVAHLVFTGRWATGDDQEIRDLGFSDLRWNEKRKAKVYKTKHHFQSSLSHHKYQLQF
jgi:hypothetical protein